MWQQTEKLIKVLEVRILFIIGYGGSLQEASRKGGSNEMQLIISQFKFWFMEYQFQIFEVFYMYSRVWQHVCILSRFSRGRLSNVVDRSPPDSSVYGSLQARIVEWVAISLSRGSSKSRDRTPVFHMSPALGGRFFTTSATWGTQFDSIAQQICKVIQ